MSTRHFYVAHYADEVIPCATTLEAWAAWLTAPVDPLWPRGDHADGEVFEVSTIDELAEIEAVLNNEVWVLLGEPPAAATGFVCRQGRIGWDAETWSDEPLGYLNGEDGAACCDDGDVEQIVCCREGPTLICELRLSPPALVVLGTKQ